MRRRAVVPVVVGLAVALLSLLWVPDPVLDAGRRTGDFALADRASRLVGSGRSIPSLSVVEIRGGDVRHAGLGAGAEGAAPSPERVYELGSITKTFTGMLLADAVARGEVTLDDRADRWLPALAGSEAGTATLRELATHTSGVPPVPTEMVGRVLASNWTGANWSDPDTGTLLGMVARTPLQNRGAEVYSNAGVAVLGHAVAAASDQPDYATLLRARLLEPLGMRDTRLVVAPDAADPATPHLANGWGIDPWWGEGMAPAGASTRTTAADMGRFTRAVLAGTAPGMAALDPVTDPTADGDRRGLLWAINPAGPGEPALTWHNGRTGGSASMLTLDRQAGAGVVVLSDGAAPQIDRLGLRLLSGSDEPVAAPFTWQTLLPGVVALLLALGVWWRRPRHRLAAAGVLAEAVVGAVLLARFGPWGVVPGWWGALGIGLAAAGIVPLLARWHELPTHGGRPRLSAVWLSLTVLVGGALVVLALL